MARSRTFFQFLYSGKLKLCGVSLLTLTAISVDRLLALLLGLRYRQVVTVKKTYVAILAFWIVSVVGVPASTAIREYVYYTGTALCLAITIVAYSYSSAS